MSELNEGNSTHAKVMATGLPVLNQKQTLTDRRIVFRDFQKLFLHIFHIRILRHDIIRRIEFPFL